MLSAIAQKQIIAHLYVEEEFRLLPYNDLTGKEFKLLTGNLTMGLGWNIQTVGCPKPIAEFAALYFINLIDVELTQDIHFYSALDDVRKIVLCDMAYNMGGSAVLNFNNMLNAMAKGDFKTAAIAMLQSKWAKQVGQRAVNLSKMMESGQWI